MNFRTEIFPSKSTFNLSLRQDQLFVGSCFTENMSKRLQGLGMPVTVNPHGILFNPVSVVRCLRDLLEERRYSEDDLEEFNDKFISFFHHGSFSDADRSSALAKINESITKGRGSLQKAQTLFITLGSSWAYRHKEKNVMVANCHKVPQQTFQKELISHDKTVLLFRQLLEKLFAFNKDLQVVFTISPVRHWKDGFAENQLSKSHLTIAAHALADLFDQVHYFPAYELLMDDLRDYRFYKSDMLHPNEQAKEYVWEKFKKVFFTEDDLVKIKQIEKINKSLAHVPQKSDDVEYQNWQNDLQRKKEILLEGEN